MNNIIASDFYRVRRGAALRNTFLGMVAIVALILILVLVSQNSEFSMLMIDSSTEYMTPSEVEALQQDLGEASKDTETITNGAFFGEEMLSQFFIAFFFLPIAVAVFCADFSASTYRNTLSFESNRTKVYIAKLLLSMGLCLALVLGTLLVGWLLGGIALGFTGFTAAYFAKIGTILLLQLPIYLAFVAVCHCLVAFTKKSSTTIAIFLVGNIALAVILQTLVMAVPSLDWLALLDPQSSGRIMASYETVPVSNIQFIVGYNVAVTIVATALGIAHYRKTDMP